MAPPTVSGKYENRIERSQLRGVCFITFIRRTCRFPDITIVKKIASPTPPPPPPPTPPYPRPQSLERPCRARRSNNVRNIKWGDGAANSLKYPGFSPERATNNTVESVLVKEMRVMKCNRTKCTRDEINGRNVPGTKCSGAKCNRTKCTGRNVRDEMYPCGPVPPSSVTLRYIVPYTLHTPLDPVHTLNYASSYPLLCNNIH